jgi:phosphatidylglycerophosphate synthase
MAYFFDVSAIFMSLFYHFKPLKDRYLRLIAIRLTSSGVTANKITAFGLCLALCAGFVAYSGYLYAALVLFSASALCDALDGSLARLSSEQTEFGLYFDGMADRFSELFFVGGAVLGAHAPPSGLAVVAGAFLLLFARMYGHTQYCGTVATPFGRPERLTLLVAGLLSPHPLNIILFVAAALGCVVSAAQVVARTRTMKPAI